MFSVGEGSAVLSAEALSPLWDQSANSLPENFAA